MSLTSMLDESTGVLRRWWDEEFPTVKSLLRDGAWKGQLAAPPPETARKGSTPGLVGTALDYRVRWLWPHVSAADLIGVSQGASLAFNRDRTNRFAAEVDALAADLAGPASWDSVNADELLARLALVLGQLEASWRSGWPLDAATSGIKAKASLDQMLAAQRSDLVGDIRAIVAAGRVHLEPLIVTKPILNPTFNQSRLVDGADADLIVAGCLVELRTTAGPSMASNEIRQLVTYALLDDINEHQIRDVAMFYIRRPQYLHWRLDTLLKAAGSTKTRADLSVSLIDTLRSNVTNQAASS